MTARLAAMVCCSRLPRDCRFSWQFSSVCFAVRMVRLGAARSLRAASLLTTRRACKQEQCQLCCKMHKGSHG